MRVYLIRHAESEENAALRSAQVVSTRDFNDLLARSPHAPLTPQGEAQAAALAERLAGAGIEAIYTSPFLRAARTAEVLAARIALQLQVVAELHEVMPPTRSDGHGPHSLVGHFARSYLRMLAPGSNGETLLAGYRRARVAWAHITAAPAREIAAVSHYGLISLILLSLRDDSRWRICARDLGNGGVTIIEKATIQG